MSEAHSKAIWRESSAGGAVLGAVPAFLVADGSDVVFSTTGPERYAFYDVEENGDYWLLDFTPVYVVYDGADFVFSLTGPAVAILADAGGGDIELTTDLTREPVADFFYDLSGDLWLVRRDADRLDAVQFSTGDIQLY